MLGLLGGRVERTECIRHREESRDGCLVLNSTYTHACIHIQKERITEGVRKKVRFICVLERLCRSGVYAGCYMI